MNLPEIESTFREGVRQLQQERYSEALQHLDTVLQALPAQLDASYFKSLALLNLKRYAEVIDCLQPALSLEADTTPASLRANCHKALGSAFQALKSYGRAIQAFETACKLEPGSTDRRLDLLQCRLKAGQQEQVASDLREVETIDPNHVRVIAARAELAFQSWNVPEYIRHIQRAIPLQPSSIDLICQYLMALNYLEDETGASTAADEHVAIGTALQTLLPATTTHRARGSNTLVDRPLRIGFISPDLKQHSVSYFLLPLLRGLQPRSDVQTFCYSTAMDEDEVTREIRSRCSVFRLLQSSREFDSVEFDQLDILIDLAGHTHSNHFEALIHNRKLAPVYAHWMGYPNTTGFACFDFRIVDSITDPPNSSESCSEQRLFLEPCFLCYEPPDAAPEVSPLPALRSEWITLASYNNLNKVTPAMLHIWARMLAREPRFRLRIKSPLVTVHGVAPRLRKPFDELGINPERIQLIPAFQNGSDYLASYSGIDFTLDPFPYNGTTTTFESLLMGCPVLTLSGNSHRSRVSNSILSHLGLDDWITHSPDAYLERGLRTASELNELADLRVSLRERLLQSPLCDADAFAQGYLDTLRRAGVGSSRS